jgi:hypothetical protein
MYKHLVIVGFHCAVRALQSQGHKSIRFEVDRYDGDGHRHPTGESESNHYTINARSKIQNEKHPRDAFSFAPGAKGFQVFIILCAREDFARFSNFNICALFRIVTNKKNGHEKDNRGMHGSWES